MTRTSRTARASGCVARRRPSWLRRAVAPRSPLLPPATVGPASSGSDRPARRPLGSADGVSTG